MASNALRLISGVQRMQTITSAGITVQDEGSIIISGAQTLNFKGSALSAVTDEGSDVAGITVGGTGNIYDQVVTVPSGGYAIDTILTLPSSQTYIDKDLKVFAQGKFLEESIEYEYVGTGDRTQIKLLKAREEGEHIRYIVEGIAANIYDEVTVVPGGGLAGGTNLTLPSSGTYATNDLKLYLNGQLLEVTVNYNYVGSTPRTQVQTVMDLFEGERVRFRKEDL